MTGVDPQAAAGRRRGAALILLSFAAGTMDAIAFIALGDVFTSAMSGNTILLGLALGQGQFAAAARSLAAFVGYALGVAGAAVTLRTSERGIRRTLGVELLLLAAFAGWWTVRGGTGNIAGPYGLIVLSAAAMGLQGGIGRAMGVTGVPTIVITSTLTAIIGGLAERALSHRRPVVSPAARQQIAAFLAYLVSAVIGGIAMRAGGLFALPYVPLAAVLVLWLVLQFGFVRLEPD